MNRVAKFEKVSEKQYIADYLNTFKGGEENFIKNDIYSNIVLPARSTSGSAGYDFVTPIGFTLKPGETIKIPSGIRCKMNEDYVLILFPRSSLGFKYRLQIDNTIPVIDSDYYNADNEGHIFIKLTNDSKEDKVINVSAGDKIVQGIFLQYGITEDDNVDVNRTGGLGSTGR